MNTNFNRIPKAQVTLSRPASITSDMSNTRSLSHDDERPRKRVRKGTKSCWECKRRKVKCQLSSEDVPVCSGCLARGTTCLSQEFPEERDTSGGLQVGERLGRVEQLLETLLGKVTAFEEEDQAQKIISPEARSNDVLNESAAEVHANNDSSPFMALFDNPVIGHVAQAATPVASPGTRTPSTRTTCGRPTKAERLRQTLFQLMPSQADMDTLQSTNYCALLINSMSWASVKTKDGRFVSPFNVSQIEQQNPTLIARTLLYVAVCLQQLDPAFDQSQLHIQPSIKTRKERIIATVNALVTSDDELVTSLEGIECLILQGMLWINEGSPRRAWLVFRRALNLGQLMGLGNSLPDGTFSRARPMWHQLVQGDRYLSLLLGLPAGTNDDSFEPDETFQNPDIDKDNLFGRKLGAISLRIIQRNQAGSTPAYAGTQEIDDMLDNLAREMPSTWWEIPTFNSEGSSHDASASMDRLMTQIWFFQIQALVHLPFMLRASTERRFEYSRFSCVKACREVVWRYLALRKSSNKTFCCKVIDFGALTATVGLFLGVVDLHHSGGNADASQQTDFDRELINQVLQTMEEVSKNGNEIMASQSVSVIKSLLSVEDPHANQNASNLRLTIPYFGTLTIVRPQPTQTLTPISQPSHSSSPAQEHVETIPPALYQTHQGLTPVSQDVNAQTWHGMQMPEHTQNSLNFPTVSFQSSYFNQVPPQPTNVQNLGWEDSDTLFFDGLLNTDIDGNWTF